tara:strand:- start:5 stop:478 length:474 start_codon:yes stop_codon:yes gene_type:complete
VNLLAKKLINKLKKKKLTISVAESCTGGLLSTTITSTPGSSKVFTAGLVVYSNKSKIKFLKVSKKIINKHGAVSWQVCLALLKNVSKITKSSISISITGIAGPSGATHQKPIGLVYIGIKKNKKFFIRKFLFKNNGRFYIQRIAVNKAIRLILTFIK